MRIAIITTHPIQYHAPLYAFLASSSVYTLKIFYTLGDQGEKTYDREFGIHRSWNIDLFSGYNFEFLENTSVYKSSHSFWGIQNPTIIDKVNEFNPTMILIYGWRHYSHLKVLRHFKGKITILFRGDSTTLDDGNQFSLKNILKYNSLKWVYSNVDFVLSPGKASDQYFLKAGFPSERIIRAPHAIDNDRFTSFSVLEKNDLELLRDKLHILKNEFIFLFAGKFSKKKNPLLLIKAFAEIASEYDHIRLLLIGNGNLERAIIELCSTLSTSISNRIHIIPFQDQHQIKLFYRLAHVVVLPSQGPSETWGLCINESLASGTPVIVSNKCGCAYDLVKHTLNGLIFESNNFIDLFEKMKLMANPEFYSQIKFTVQSELDKYSFSSFKEALDKISIKLEN